MRNYEGININDDERNDPIEKSIIVDKRTLTFNEREDLLEEFYKKNWNNLERNKLKLRRIENKNELVKNEGEKFKEHMKYHKFWCWEFFRSAYDKLKIAIYREGDEPDSILEKKRN
jgi:hypothetical protein